MKNTIRLTETQLQQVINESVNRVIRESKFYLNDNKFLVQYKNKFAAYNGNGGFYMSNKEFNIWDEEIADKIILALQEKGINANKVSFVGET